MKKAKNIIVIAVLILMMIQFVDIVRFYEKYSTTAKYHLKQDILNGDKEAIEYYNNTYVKNGIDLFK